MKNEVDLDLLFPAKPDSCCRELIVQSLMFFLLHGHQTDIFCNV